MRGVQSAKRFAAGLFGKVCGTKGHGPLAGIIARGSCNQCLPAAIEARDRRLQLLVLRQAAEVAALYGADEVVRALAVIYKEAGGRSGSFPGPRVPECPACRRIAGAAHTATCDYWLLKKKEAGL